MKQWLRRGSAMALAALVLWVVWVTAPCVTASAALEALGSAAGRNILRWEMGDLLPRHDLPVTTLLAVAQSPLLLEKRQEVAQELARQEEREPSPAPQEMETTVPVEETPLVPERKPEAAEEDNGVPARTLVPTDESGYTVSGDVYVSNTTDYVLTEADLTGDFAAALGDSGPQVLILHTHGSEAYTPVDPAAVTWSGAYRTTETAYNVVGVGDVMAETLGRAGISVLHDRTMYDYPEYSGAYDRALEAIRGHLERYPSIRFVLDVHRDAVEDAEGRQYKVVASGEDAEMLAQLTLVVGSDGGGLTHPNWRENLKLASALQGRLLEENDTLMRPLLLRNSRYNQHATTGSLLLEVGAAGNSPEEAERAGRLFARTFAEVVKR